MLKENNLTENYFVKKFLSYDTRDQYNILLKAGGLLAVAAIILLLWLCKCLCKCFGSKKVVEEKKKPAEGKKDK